jgi:DNA-binding NarL/FixJ family response regulator
MICQSTRNSALRYGIPWSTVKKRIGDSERLAMELRIVIADDHERVRRSIRLLLAHREGWSICGEAADGLEATELARRLRPDVVLMDMSMPRMDGIDAARIIRRELPEIKVIIISQNDPWIVQRRSTEVEAHGYLGKSAMANELIPAILNATGGLDAGSAYSTTTT